MSRMDLVSLTQIERVSVIARKFFLFLIFITRARDEVVGVIEVKTVALCRLREYQNDRGIY